jgi:hypothetical protein
MRRVLIGSTLALALAIGLVAVPSIAAPQQAPQAQAQSAGPVGFVFYGPWLCQKATGYNAYPRSVHAFHVADPGITVVLTPGNAVRVTGVIIGRRTMIAATIKCPHPKFWWWPPADQYVNVSGERTFRFSGDAHWMNTWDVGKR